MFETCETYKTYGYKASPLLFSFLSSSPATLAPLAETSPAEFVHNGGESLPELPQLEVVPLDRAKNLWHSEPIHREIHR